MALSMSPDFGNVELPQEESPCTTSSDDLFADINWPEDAASSPFDEDGFAYAMSNDRSNESPQESVNSSPAFSNMSGSEPAVDMLAPAASATNAAKKCSGGCRFSKEAKSILRTWFNEHKDNPYPTPEEKKALAERTQLKHGQISLWLVNTRRRYRSRKQREARTGTLPQTMLPPPLPGGLLDPNPDRSISAAMRRPFEEMNPMDRWKFVTPLENEPAETDVILGTVAAAPPLSFDPYSVQHRHSANRFDSDLQSSTCISNDDYFWSRSMASYETGMTSMVTGSTISDSTVFSYPVLNNSQVGSRDRRRRRGNPTRSTKSSTKDHPFQCTFCLECTFVTKHDWQRHEKSQHLSLESWTCCLSGGTVDTPTGPACAFCETPNPSAAHLETHSFSACEEKDLKERTFYRKDHFQQHLRLTHESKFRSAMESWRTEIPMVRSRCGFCNATFTTWTARTDHLAAHFKCHAKMKDWVGDWGFEPHIAALVEGIENPQNLQTQAHPLLTMPSMPPPSLPLKAFSSAVVEGGGGGVYEFPQPAFTSDEIDSILAFSASMDTPGLSTGFLGLGNEAVSDWVDFAA